jgi:hypothetical protein
MVTLLCLSNCADVSLKGEGLDQHILVQSRDKQFSCYSAPNNTSADCCWPWQEKLMICTYTVIPIPIVGDGTIGGSIVIKYIWDKQKRQIVKVLP